MPILRPITFWHRGGSLPTQVGTPIVWYAAESLSGLADNSPVASWPDSSNTGAPAEQATADKRPLYKASGGPGGRPYVVSDGSNDALKGAASSALELPTGDFTFVAVFKPAPGADCFVFSHVANGGDYGGYSLRVLPDGRPYIWQAANETAYGSWVPFTANLQDGNWHIVVFRRAGGLATVCIDGVAIGTYPSNYLYSYLGPGNPWLPAINGPATGRGFELFTFADGNYSATAIHEIVGYAESLDPEKLRALVAHYAARCSISLSGDTKNYLLFDGNSIVYGQSSTPAPESPNVSATSNDIASIIVRDLGGTSQWTYQNYGVPGFTTKRLKLDLEKRLQKFLDHGGRKRALFVMEGTNDMGSIDVGETVALTPAQAFASLKDYCSKVKSACPWIKVVVGTVCPWKYDYAGSPNPLITSQADMEVVRQSYNQMIRDEPLGPYWDAVADAGADPLIGVPGANEVSPGVAGANTYFADGTHLTNAGYVVLAGVVKAALLSVLPA